MGIGYTKRMSNYGKTFPTDLTPKQRRRMRKKSNRDLKILSSNKG